MDIGKALEPPLEVETLVEAVPELSLSMNVAQSPYHHLDTFEHILEVIRSIERELEEGRIGAYVEPGRVPGLRLVGLLHDIAKPVTRGEVDGKVLFVAHDTLGCRLAYRVCRRLGFGAGITDLTATLTALHLKIGFMAYEHTDYPPPRLARAAGPFGEELAVLSWADRLAAQGPSITEEHLERHRELCVEFLRESREAGPYPAPDYGMLARKLGLPGENEARAGYAASHLRVLEARGAAGEGALEYLSALNERT